MTHPAHFVAVNYRGAATIAPFVDSLRVQTVGDWSCVLVDNSEDPAEAERLQSLTADDKNIEVVCAPRNLGYFGAAAWWTGPAPPYEWVIVSNTDIVLADDFVACLTRTDGGQFVTAPAVTHEPCGFQQNPFMVTRPSTRSMRFRATVFSSRPVSRLYAWGSATVARKRGPVPPGRARDIYAAHGSIMALHRRYFTAGGTLHHEPFMYGEEITIAENVRRLGGAIRFEPSLRATHHANQATGTSKSRTIWRMQRDGTRNSYRLIREG